MASTLVQPPPVTHPITGWDSELFVLRAADRAALRERALTLAAGIREQSAVAVAASLASELVPGGARLTVVASSVEDLQNKHQRAAAKLNDPKCHQIRDASGIYYFDHPLSAQGTVALLFPGEGAQYLNMLADLCGVFPEVEETFAWCDQLAAEAGRPEASLRRVLHLPPDASAEEKAAAEAELRGLGPSIFGVLLADQAIYRILEKLRVPVSATAGHSAGELGALLASGAMASADQHGSRLPEIMEIMQRQEDEAGGPDVALLAVGASKATIVEVANAVAGGAVIVAMDNCPHQCVAVGPTHSVSAVEAALAERGVICERLPFKRPYHTPLFEPYMGAFRELFADVPFHAPHTPIYCCSTGTKFPTDPKAMRDLAVNHWVMPVEFTRMIETMHNDGVRLFVECGPRGNLSAFVEDILRGKPFAAIPANVPRKSGPTQINHMVAQLVAHGVELELSGLYEGRVAEKANLTPPAPFPKAEGGARGSLAGLRPSPTLGGRGSEANREGSEKDNLTPPAPFPKAEGGAREEAASETSREPVFSPSPTLGGRGSEASGEGSASAILHNYLDVMEQFLDTQREVMTAFLSGHSSSAALSPELFASLDLSLPVSDSAPSAQHSVPPFALVGEVTHYSPGHDIVFRRVLDEREDLYADDHTLGGRGVSRENPAQNGLPVLPMTFSLEAMSEAASLLAPGKVVIAIRNVRLFRWLPFDPQPTTLEVRAAVASVDPESGVVEVKADVRDLGNSFLRDGANKPASEAVIVLADHYPPSPAAQPFVLTEEVRCKSTIDDLRRNMFHGPIFQMLRTLDRTGREGIEGTLEVQTRESWFRSNPQPHIAIDPVLLDAAMHILGAWHLEQPDWTGRILLPFEVQRIDYFGPTPEVGSRLLTRGHNEQESARHYRHGLEVFGSNGNLWLRMSGAGYWRFYLPFGHVNFFGPKDEYFLSRDWPEAVLGIGSGSDSAIRNPQSAFPRCHFLEPPVDLKQPVLRAAGARVTMTPRELDTFLNWQGTDAELNDWFFGRMLAKDAVRAAWNKKHGEAMFPADMETEDADGRIVCRPRGEPKSEPFPPVRVAIAEGKVAAFAAFAERLGIAIVAVTKNAPPEAEREAQARAACAAVADALRVPAEKCRLVSLDATGAAFVEIEKVCVRVQTARQKDAVVATTLCEAG